MKEGSFDINEQVAQEYVNAPLPDVLPVPQNWIRNGTLVKSRAVDSLLDQNEDLMARLGVALRKISEMEDEFNFLRQKNEVLELKSQGLKDQLLVLREKEKSIAFRRDSFEDEINNLKERIQLHEVKYTELLTTARERQRQLLVQIHALGARIKRFLKFRQGVSQAHITLKKKKSDWNAHRTSLETQVLDLSSEIASLKQRLAEVVQRLQATHKEASLRSNQIVETYETRIKELDQRLAQFADENSALLKRTVEFDKLYSENIELKNKSVQLERQYAEIKTKWEDFEANHHKEALKLRTSAKSVSNDNIKLKQDMFALEKKVSDLSQKERLQQEQIENLQDLLRQQMDLVEKEKAKNESLQGLNHSISLQLQQERKNQVQHKASLEKEWLTAADQTLKAPVEAKEKRVAKEGPTPKDPSSPHAGKLWLELQSGFSVDASKKSD